MFTGRSTVANDYLIFVRTVPNNNSNGRVVSVCVVSGPTFEATEPIFTSIACVLHGAVSTTFYSGNVYTLAACKMNTRCDQTQNCNRRWTAVTDAWMRVIIVRESEPIYKSKKQLLYNRDHVPELYHRRLRITMNNKILTK